MADSSMDGEKFRGQLSSIAFGNVMAAAARDYQKEVLEGQKKHAAAAKQSGWDEFDLDSLAEDPELERLHAQRLAEMKKENERRQALQRKGHGEFREITEEQFLEEVTGSERVVIHFFHKEFVRCKVMDKHIALLAPKYLDTKFARIDAERCPFFVSKLAIKVLPCVILFRGGVAVDRIVGFQELGGTDDFTTPALEARLVKQGVIVANKKGGSKEEENPHWQKNVRSSTWDNSDSDSD